MSARFNTGYLGTPPFRNYLFAIALAGVAVAIRAAMETIAPGNAYFITLFPAIVFAGVFYGTAPAAVASAAGGIAICSLFIRSSILVWPPVNSTQLDVLIFVPACTVVLWATHTLRQSIKAVTIAEARLGEVFRQLPGAAAILEAPSGRLLMRSTQSQTVLGERERRLQTSDDLASYGGVHADGRPYAADDYPIVRALKTGEIIKGERIKYLRPDGNSVDLEVHAGPVRDPSGRVVAAVGMAFEVSEQVEAERQLQKSEAQYCAIAGRLRAAVDAGGLGLWEVNLKNDTIMIDAALASMLSMPSVPSEMPRADFRNLIDLDDRQRVASVFAGATAAGGLYADEFKVRTVQGDLRWFVSRGAVLANLQKAVGVISDITERRMRENALQDALQANDILMHEADHRIKNSLQLVVSMLRLQLAKVSDNDAKQMLSDAIARVDAVANVHLALQRSPDLQNIEIDRMLEDLAAGVGSLNPLVKVHCKVGSLTWINADKAIPLGLLVSEILTNALKHAYPAGVPGKVLLTAESDVSRLELIISDQGIGLPQTTAVSGLGTSVVFALARQIGAAINTESSPGLGTTVKVTISH